jgi:hypothetical protein
MAQLEFVMGVDVEALMDELDDIEFLLGGDRGDD